MCNLLLLRFTVLNKIFHQFFQFSQQYKIFIGKKLTIAHCECQKKFYIIFFLWKTHKPCLDQYRIYFFAFKRAILFPKAHYPLHAKLGNLRNGMNKYQVKRNVLENVSTSTRVFCFPVMNGKYTKWQFMLST